MAKVNKGSFLIDLDERGKQYKTSKFAKFIEQKAKVTVTIVLKGRERGKQDMARQLLSKFAELSESTLENVSFSGNRISAKIK